MFFLRKRQFPIALHNCVRKRKMFALRFLYFSARGIRLHLEEELGHSAELVDTEKLCVHIKTRILTCM